MKVLHLGKFYLPHRGGMETYLALLCQELKSYVELDVVVSSDDHRSKSEVVNGVSVRRLPTWFNFSSAAIGPGLLRAIKRSEADIVHLHFPHPTAILAWLASRHSGRLVIGYHSDIIRQRLLGAAFAPFLEAALSRASAIVVASPQYIDSSSVLRRYRDRCIVIPYGIRLENYDEIDDGLVARIRAAAGPRIVLAVGRLVGYKGFQFLVRAMAHVDARLVLIGDGPLRSALFEEARRCGVQAKVDLLGRVDDVRPYYQAADVFVLPSVTRAEGFGIVQLEAMAYGKPIVNTALDTGVVFASVDGQTGITVPPRESAALATAINRLLGDAPLRSHLGAAGRERVASEFTANLMVQRTLELYDAVLTSPMVGKKTDLSRLTNGVTR